MGTSSRKNPFKLFDLSPNRGRVTNEAEGKPAFLLPPFSESASVSVKASQLKIDSVHSNSYSIL